MVDPLPSCAVPFKFQRPAWSGQPVRPFTATTFSGVAIRFQSSRRVHRWLAPLLSQRLALAIWFLARVQGTAHFLASRRWRGHTQGIIGSGGSRQCFTPLIGPFFFEPSVARACGLEPPEPPSRAARLSVLTAPCRPPFLATSISIFEN